MKTLNPPSVTLPFVHSALIGSPLVLSEVFFIMQKRSVEVNCPICNVVFILRPCEIGKIKTCSKECSSKLRSISRTGLRYNINYKSDEPQICEECGSIFFKNHYKKQKYCSSKCKNDVHSRNITGENSPNWKGGITVIYQKERKSREYAQWRKSVFVRDKYKCVKCGDKGRIHAHHVIRFSDDKDKMYSISNGITLCIKCHGDVHNINFENRHHKCLDCGVKISNRAIRCSSCNTKLQWKTEHRPGRRKQVMNTLSFKQLDTDYGAGRWDLPNH